MSFLNQKNWTLALSSCLEWAESNIRMHAMFELKRKMRTSIIAAVVLWLISSQATSQPFIPVFVEGSPSAIQVVLGTRLGNGVNHYFRLQVCFSVSSWEISGNQFNLVCNFWTNYFFGTIDNYGFVIHVEVTN